MTSDLREETAALPDAVTRSRRDDLGNVDLTPEFCAELLDPASWSGALKSYAGTTRLAVALIDPLGRLLGTCHNPQPIWTLARNARPEWGPRCLFCLDRATLCTAALDALRTNSVVLVHEQAGFAHIASPLLLSGRHLGTLLAGQVFDRYPEPIPLERLARQFDLSAQHLWLLARQQAPISSTNLIVYGNLLSFLGQAFLRERYGAILERRLAQTNKELQSSNQELESVNSELSRKISELDGSHSDLRNLIDNTQIATIFLDRELRIKSFTPAVGSLFQLKDSDIGRSIGDLTATFAESLKPGILEDFREVLKTLSVLERDLTGANRQHYLMRILPYRTVQNEIVGLVITFTNVTQLKQAERLAEDRVRDRTAQLQAVNQELETFVYSVSHDLRAPLRGIDGWSQALAEECGTQIDRRGQNYLDRVRAETRRLGGLIDDLLQLSHLTRVPLELHPVDLTALANTIAMRIQETYSGRRLLFLIAPHLTASGDAHLLEIALTNLLDNAAKFTRTREEGLIEFGQACDKGENVFYVRDNGAGFDMAHAGALFVAFQRLHKPSEFPGSGIGLATVQRVIQRHHGRVWADAAVDRGATFFFTLGDAQ